MALVAALVTVTMVEAVAIDVVHGHEVWVRIVPEQSTKNEVGVLIEFCYLTRTAINRLVTYH